MLEFSGFSKGSTAMSKRKFLSPAQKIAIVREHLIDGIKRFFQFMQPDRMAELYFDDEEEAA